MSDVFSLKAPDGIEVLDLDSSGNLTITGTLTAAAFSSSGADDFGSAGIKADVVAESTAATGVTVDGLLIKDGGARVADSGVLSFGADADILLTHNGTASVVVSNAAAGVVDFHDDVLQIVDPADATKKVRIDAGTVATGTTRVITMPDANVALGDIATQAAQIAALGAENTDGRIEIPLLAGIGDAGTWTKSLSAGVPIVTRTAAAATESFWVEIPIPARTTASKGVKPTGLRVNYSVNTADATDITCEVWKLTEGADGANPTAAVLFGEDDLDYDAAHNTAAERGDDTAAPELHLAVVTDAGTPAYLAAGERLLFRFKVVDPGTSAVILKGATLVYSETLVDLA